MTTENRQEGFIIEPKLGDLRNDFIDFCRRVESELAKSDRTPRIEASQNGSYNNDSLKRLRREILPSKDESLRQEEIKLELVKSIILDLVAQDWNVQCDTQVKISPPPQHDSPKEEKERIRRRHLIGRDAQLREDAVVEFIRDMECRRLTAKGWQSIFSLMRDGRELSGKLEQAAAASDEDQKLGLLQQTICPYLQFVEGDEICEHTGLRLREIWRYFRHTWVSEYKSTPGRSMMILLRDAAAPNHPVIGIGALGSSLVQHNIRDQWIRWYPETFTKQLINNPSEEKAEWLLISLQNLIDAIYTKDLIEEGILKITDMQHPTSPVIMKLKEESEQAKKQHHLYPHSHLHKSQGGDPNEAAYWESKAHTSLFRSKRCEHLADLMSIRMVFQEHNLNSGSHDELKETLKSKKVQTAIGTLVRMIKAEHVGIDMMDIIICGAVAPYNVLIGGKLMCMMLCSPEVNQYYARRYGEQISIIASSIKGLPVRRKPQLVLLCTTSLYGVGSSQYNRVRVPAESIGGLQGEKLEYKELGLSEGYGSFHFSRDTIKLITMLVSRRIEGRRVNSIFGEGVNPLMRKIREALDAVGLPSDQILKHRNRRVVYGVALARNFREILLGLESKADYIIPQTRAQERTDLIAEYWRRRWLAPRIHKLGILEEVAKHTLSYPVTHGARIALVTADDENSTGYLWALGG
jgi:hypothetical protein